MELSPTRELDLEGWRNQKSHDFQCVLKTSSRISKEDAPDVTFCSFSAERDPNGYAKAPPIHQKWIKNGVQNSLGFPLAARSLPEGVQGSKRYPHVVENRGVCDRFSVEVQ